MKKRVKTFNLDNKRTRNASLKQFRGSSHVIKIQDEIVFCLPEITTDPSYMKIIRVDI